MNYLLEQKTKLSQALVAAGFSGITAGDWLYPPQADLGDLSLPSFRLAKEVGISPAEMASKLAAVLSEADYQASTAGPYVNVTLPTVKLIEEVVEAIDRLQEKYGHSDDGQGQEVMIEYSNVNTHKEYHLGHLRNLAYGDAVSRLYQLGGWQVWPVSYVNDFGIHTAKTIWQWQRQPAVAEGDSSDKGYQLGQAYVASVTALKEASEHEVEVSQIMKSIEARSGDAYGLWAQTRQWSLDYFASIYRELGVEFKEYYYESEYIDQGRQLVDELLEKGILVRSEGAVIADLRQYDLDVLVLVRSDGTTTYPVADLALASEKFRRHNLAKSLYVVDNRQTLYFKQLFKILELMGYEAQMSHLAYDFVKLPSGMMSSRSGNTVTYRDLYLQLFDKLKTEIVSRHADWAESEVVEIANKLTVAVLKFELLKVGADKIITFDINEALRFDGFTAIYLQYVAARINSLQAKATAEAKADASQLTEGQERELVLKLARYPEVLAVALETHNPSELAKYLFELAAKFNDYYHNVPILVAEASKQGARLHLLANVKQVLTNALAVLGIETVAKM